MSGFILNANVYDFGADAGAWRAPGTQALDNLDEAFWRRIARTAEDGGLDGIFLADGPGLSSNPAIRPNRMVEPLATLAVVLSETTRLGVIATVSTGANDPLELAGRLLDYNLLSQGRFGWNVVTGLPVLSAQDFQVPQAPEREDRYARATEFLAVYRGYLAAVQQGSGFEHAGERFRYSVSAEELPTQGPAARFAAAVSPLIVQAGGSEQGRRLAAGSADAVFSAETVFEVARRNRQELHTMARELGRRPPVVLPGVHLVIGSTEAEAEARFQLVHQRGPEGYVLKRFASLLDVDAALLDLEAPASALDQLAGSTERGSAGFRKAITAYGKANGLSIAQLVRHFSGFGHQFFVGTPEQFADVAERWWRGDAADGFNLLFDANPLGMQEFVDQVVPVLRQRGLVAPEPPSRHVPFAQRLKELSA
ncbi:LLM class flavin-dependent oxidoreductase [Xylophilus rhododendri]|uniref:LLM class flavin-dependent oxidoreductase n=1 Tax=Xylophilus rhododendri TaxID=2697032 RepID=A0A857JCH9_9BURK|nr:LLM class flavin-dependent oxidoreductase [Xylophilus rhododendri]QHJ00914.1 LLM class flavin-dependent oxidoreductase [Xylophilus rhododendri]